MASWSLTVAAFRYRRSQALLVVALSAVVTAAAALGPLYAREVEQSVLRTVLADAPPGHRGIVISSAGNRPPAPDVLVRQAQVGLSRVAGGTRLFAAPIGGAEVDVLASGVRSTGSARLVFRDGACAHLVLVRGVCPRDRNQVLVSRRTADALKASTGSLLLLVESSDRKRHLTVTVTGVYRPYDAASNYWMDRTSGATRSNTGVAAPPPVDALVTPWSTLGSGSWNALRTYADVPLRPGRADIESVPALRSAEGQVDQQVRGVTASAATGLNDLLRATSHQRAQARRVVPLLAVQVAVLGIVVLGFVCAAATEARRPEIALARLRGQGARGATRLVMAELGTLVILGGALGAVCAWLAAGAVGQRWLASGVQPELRWPLYATVAAAALAGIGAVLVAATPTLRQPVVSLLRRVPPRSSTLQVGLVEGALAAAAGAGLVTLLAGRVEGPVALLAPGLLAVAGGLLLAQAVVPVAAPLGRAALRRGSLGTGLAGTQLARRPALRRLIAIITVACALLVFAVDTWVVADRNRAHRASVEAGAPVVLTVDAANAETLQRAVLAADPRSRFATPVVTSLSATDQGPRTTAIDPTAFARIASWAGRPSAAALSRIRPGRVAPVVLSGDRVVVTADFSARSSSLLRGHRLDLQPFSLSLTVSDGHGGLAEVPLGQLRPGTATYRAPLPCGDQPCRLEQIALARSPGDPFEATFRLQVRRLSSGSATSMVVADLGPVGNQAWQPLPDPVLGTADFDVSVKPPLTMGGTVYTGPFIAQRGNLPAVPAALVAGHVPALPGSIGQALGQVLAPGLGLRDRTYQRVGRLPAIPRTGGRGVLVDLSSLAAVSGGPGSRTTYSVWLRGAGSATERQLVQTLARHGVVVTSRDTSGDHDRALAAEGPAAALRLALFAGLVAVLLAGAVVIVAVATSGAARARDLAGLRVVGVPVSVVRGAAVREHLGVAVLGVLAGAFLGLLAAQIALPQIPLYARPNPSVPVGHQPAWWAVLGTTVFCLLLLSLISVLVGRALAGAATPDRLRDQR